MSEQTKSLSATLGIRRRMIATSVALAYGVGLWTHAVHWRAGAREEHAIAFVPHWLRDSTLSLSLILLAGVVATLNSQRSQSSVSRRAAIVGICSAGALALGVPFHGGLFGHAAHAHGGVQPQSTWLAMLVEFVLDVPIAIVIAVAMSKASMVNVSRLRDRIRAGRPLRTGMAATLVMMTGSMALVILPKAQAVTPAPSVCPATAPLRHFDVQSINLRITLNKFGDNDPAGRMYALTSQIPAIRAQEASRDVSLGLRSDPIQPLVIRANEGDCVDISFTNNLAVADGAVGVHVDGLPYDTSGDNVGINGSTEAAKGATKVYRVYVPNDPALEGSHYLSPGPGHRSELDHGLFGVLAVEPTGSKYLLPADAKTPIESGWEAVIVPPSAPSFRENVKILHEIGNEAEFVYDKNGNPLPQVDPITESYRPGGRGFNYRSEPFMDRLLLEPGKSEKAHAYSSTVFGDPATIIPQGYLSDPTKFRVVHAGAEVFHVYHLHGGGDRWRMNPQSDSGWKYSDVGLHKTPLESSSSDRLDAVSTGPGEHFNAEIEGGAGGAQQAAGDFLFHCHIAEHYPSGMWGLWRVFDTMQPGLAPLPDRVAPPTPVTSAQLIGTTVANGTAITAATIDTFVRPMLPAQGVALGGQDASVWDWTVDNTNPAKPLYLGEPEPATAQTPNFVSVIAGHPGSIAGDTFVGSRPVLLFNPKTGKPTYPLIRPHLDRRPPFSPNEHSGAPGLGETADLAPNPASANPWLARPDGLCPATAPVRTFNVVAVPVPIQVTANLTDKLGMLFTLASNKAALLAGTSTAPTAKREPLAIRMNVGDCANVTLTSEETDAGVFDGYAKVEMHIHHVQFDPQGSDGTSAGYNFEHSIRPYAAEDTTLGTPVAAGATTIVLNRLDPKYRPRVAIGVGLGTDGIDIATIVSVDAATNTIVLNKPLAHSHLAGEGAGVEFMRYRWYADALLDNIFWHDHVDGIHGWGHGGVGMLVVEPRGSTYHDPKTGDQINSGTIVDIHTTNPLAPGLVEGSFREMVLWTLDDTPATDSTLNLRAAPFSDRGSDASLRFSSYTWGDPGTPLLKAYVGDPVVIRTVHVGPTIDSLRFDGHQFYVEKRSRNSTTGQMYSRIADTIHAGVSERHTLILDGGAGGTSQKPGDYLYHNGVARRFRQGAWGIMRVYPGLAGDLKPLPDRVAPTTPFVMPTQTGGRPPITTDPGNPCPATAPQKAYAVSAVDMPSSMGNGARAGYTMSYNAANARRVGVNEPLIIHVAAGDCVTVTLKNERGSSRASLDVGELAKSANSSGVNIGFTPEQTVAPGFTQTYRFWADTPSIEAAVFSDFASDDSTKLGMYGAIVVGEPGAWFTDSASGVKTEIGSKVDVHIPGQNGYRDVTLLLADDEKQIGSDFMPYPTAVQRPALVNYRNAGLRTDDFSGSPTTPLIQAYVGDPMRIHVLVTPGSEQSHVFRAGGLSWPSDPYQPGSQEVAAQGLSPFMGIDAHIIGGAGGRGGQLGDFFYGDNRRPFTENGLWGILRVMPRPTCLATTPIRRLDGARCG